jgi:hypothetical protein
MDHDEIHTACGDGTPHGTGGCGRRLDGPWEGVHGVHPCPSVHLPDMVQGSRSQRGGWTTKM